MPQAVVFQSTLPAWGSDSASCAEMTPISKFQSTLPAWGSDTTNLTTPHHMRVSIHAPRVGERLAGEGDTAGRDNVSIHAPRVGERPVLPAIAAAALMFQSTLPAWGSDVFSFTFLLLL